MIARLAESVRDAVRSGFHGRRVLVVGDLMLDRYSWGDVERISPEAPIPVVRLRDETENAGGAGNVVSNLASLGLQPAVVGLVGADDAGAAIRAALEGVGAQARGLLAIDGQRTTVKHRVIGGQQQQLVRVDTESAPADAARARELLLAALDRELEERPDAVILSDYAKGVVSAELCDRAIGRARELGIPVVVDPKGRDFAKYGRATAITPNRAELALGAAVPGDSAAAMLGAARRLLDDLALDFLLLTQGAGGMTLVEPREQEHFPALAQEVFDVSGAGDTVIATLAAGLADGLGRRDAVTLANHAAGAVVRRVGTVPVRPADLHELLPGAAPLPSTRKVCDLLALVDRARDWRARGEAIVFTNGCFDLLHVGHTSLLEQARATGDRLVVGLNADDSVRRLKGEGRPLMPQEDRARLLAALEAVDAVVLFEQDDPLELITTLRPDVLVKGADYREEEVVGGADVKSWGGRVQLIDLVDGRSTTELVRRARVERP